MVNMSDNAEVSYVHAVYDKKNLEFASREYRGVIFTKKHYKILDIREKIC